MLGRGGREIEREQHAFALEHGDLRHARADGTPNVVDSYDLHAARGLGHSAGPAPAYKPGNPHGQPAGRKRVVVLAAVAFVAPASREERPLVLAGQHARGGHLTEGPDGHRIHRMGLRRRSVSRVEPHQASDLRQMPVDDLPSPGIAPVNRAMEPFPPRAIVEVVDRLIGVELEMDRAGWIGSGSAMGVDGVKLQAVIVIVVDRV